MQNVNEDKKLKSAIKKFGKPLLTHPLTIYVWIGVQPLQDIDEVNMFKDDNTVIHFKRPLSKYILLYISWILTPLCASVWYDWQLTSLCNAIVQFSVRENLLVVTGNPETKELKDMMPDILKQVGPQQLSALKDFITKMGNIPEGKAGEEDEDDVPALVGNFEDASKKWATANFGVWGGLATAH